MVPTNTEAKGRPRVQLSRAVAPRGPLQRVFLLLVACTMLLLYPVPVMSKCPNKCSGHGTCGAGDKCTCYTGWTLQDCSGQACQSSTAWVDKATAANTAHAEAECSNRGSCDYATGTCDCSDGFEGPACEKSKCPNACSGHGVCMSLYDVSRFLGVDSTGDGFGPLYTNWEKDSVYTCNCDWTYSRIHHTANQIMQIPPRSSMNIGFGLSSVSDIAYPRTHTYPAMNPTGCIRRILWRSDCRQR